MPMLLVCACPALSMGRSVSICHDGVWVASSANGSKDSEASKDSKAFPELERPYGDQDQLREDSRVYEARCSSTQLTQHEDPWQQPMMSPFYPNTPLLVIHVGSLATLCLYRLDQSHLS